MTDFKLLIPLLITTFIAIIGWIVVHWLAAARDRAIKRRELRVSYLIDAFRRIADACNREPSVEHSRFLESAISDVQLFGTTSQVKLAHEFATRMVSSGTGDLTKLLQELRDDLRYELGLDFPLVELQILRIKPTVSPEEQSDTASVHERFGTSTNGKN